MERGLEKVSLAGVLGVEQLEELGLHMLAWTKQLHCNDTYLKNKFVVNVLLGNVGVEILTLDEAEKELVDNLNVGPSDLEDRLVLLGIEGFPLRVHWGGDGSEQILAEHLDHARVHGLLDDVTVVGNVVQQFVQGQTLDFLGFHVAASIVEIKDDVALVDLLHEELGPAIGSHLVEARQLLQVSLALVRDIEARRVLSLGGSDALGDIFGRGLQSVEQQVLLAGLWRSEVSRHGFRSSGRRHMLESRLSALRDELFHMGNKQH
jgi:hypothetical protein